MNTYTNKTRYIAEYLVLNIIVCVVFFELDIISGFGNDSTKTAVFFGILLIVNTNIWYHLTLEKYRNRISLYVFTMLTYEVFIIVIYIPYWKFIYIIVICILLTVGVYIFYLVRSVKNKKINRRHFLSKCVFGVCVILGILGTSLIIPVIINTFFDVPKIKSHSITTENKYRNSKNTMDSNIEEIIKLDNSAWKKLSVSEKISVLQVVADVECNYLGIEGVEVKKKNLKEETRGVYESDKNYIVLNSQLLNENANSSEVVKVILHEVYHKYEEYLISAYNQVSDENKELLWIYRAKEYEINSQNYVKPNEKNFEEYYNQAMEEDARYYAELGYKDYYEKIEEYQKKSRAKE